MRVELAVQADGLAPQWRTLELASATNYVDFKLAPGRTIYGRVVDETGAAISNAVVRTDFDFEKQIERKFEFTTHSDQDGEFEWHSAPAEEICYWFEAGGYDPIRGMRLLANGSGYEIKLKRSSGIASQIGNQ